MNLVPEHRALFGVDVAGAASNPGYHLPVIRQTVDLLVTAALRRSGIERSDMLTWESTGDGAVVVLPSSRLGALLDAAQHLDELAGERNRWSRPEVRFRVAVELGALGDAGGFYEARITHSRMLDSKAFKELFSRCRKENAEGANTALIVSEHALRTAFGGDHTTVVRRSDFAPLPLQNKEFSGIAWARVPGFDPRSITSFIDASHAKDEERQPHPRVVNQVNGTMNGVQAEVINGGITFGTGHR